jgi:hypothetical protein
MKKTQDEKDQLNGTLDLLEQLDTCGLSEGDLAFVMGGATAEAVSVVGPSL